MAYFPVGYQPAQIYYPPQYQVQQAQQPQQYQQAQQQPMQAGFVRVQSENEARMYPVAPGNSVMFIDENSPYCYTKTMDISQLDRPKFDKYRLVKEEETTEEAVEYVVRQDLEDVWNELNQMKEKLAQIGKKRRKYEDEEDE